MFENHQVPSGKCLLASVFLFLLIGLSQSVIIVEMGDNITLECPYKANSKSVTWQVIQYQTLTDISTCYLSTGNCTNRRPDIYEADFLNSSVLTLNITGVIFYENTFKCEADDGTITGTNTLEVYVWPKFSGYGIYDNDTNRQIFCNVTDYYPELNIDLIRKEEPLTPADISSQYCTTTLKSDGRKAALCYWNIPRNRTLIKSSFSFLVSVKVSDQSKLNKEPTVPFTLSQEYSTPVAHIEGSSCLLNETSNTSYTGLVNMYDHSVRCSCYLNPIGFFIAKPQWFAQDGRAVGSYVGTSSYLDVIYNKSDPHPVYECRPAPIMRVNLTGVTYEPIFYSTPRASISQDGCRLEFRDGETYMLTKNGTTGICKCVLDRVGTPAGQAHWYKNGTLVGVENPVTRSSNLVLAWGITGEGETYECNADNMYGRDSFSYLAKTGFYSSSCLRSLARLDVLAMALIFSLSLLHPGVIEPIQLF